ncbi:MAG: hypothetical protein PHI45_01435 [Candidatus Pacebacteria bacterium]|jgi:hypothetical protein|nr:hypothetical protein [Candidatus Paceibacterota bacterium]MDD5013244.1 hypothetical protein [Candidatus Paceibacterota bacterium]MDD5752734.1 hypothetical protein [Candidatus Paceibacterota bacterium]
MIKKTKKEILQDEHLTRPPRLKAKSKNAQIKNIKKKKKTKQ